MSLKKAREIRIFQDNAYLSLDFMNQAGHLVRKSDILAFGLKMKIGLVKAGDFSSVPVHQIPIEKGEPLALEFAHFVDSVARAKQPKVNAPVGKSALEVAIAITDQIRAAPRRVERLGGFRNLRCATTDDAMSSTAAHVLSPFPHRRPGS